MLVVLFSVLSLVVAREARVFELNLCENKMRYDGLVFSQPLLKRSYILRGKNRKILANSPLALPPLIRES